MELKDFLKALIERPTDYAKLSSSEKAKFFFMTQRICSIAFPLQAQAFNHIKISQAAVTDYWHESLTNLYKKTPPWMWTKTKKSDKKDKIEMPSDEAVNYYLERTRMSKRDLDDAIKIFGDKALEPIRKIESIMAE